jgi:hypothetical protein
MLHPPGLVRWRPKLGQFCLGRGGAPTEAEYVSCAIPTPCACPCWCGAKELDTSTSRVTVTARANVHIFHTVYLRLGRVMPNKFSKT